jgi:peptidoglycan hydrolase CwlO-like protein
MRPATFSTDNPPVQIENLELAEYVNALRRRIEVQNDQVDALAAQVHKLQKENARLNNEVEKLALDLGIMDGGPGVGWVEAPR